MESADGGSNLIWKTLSLIVVINLLNRCKWMLWSNLMPPRRRPRTQTDSEPCGAPSCNHLVTNHSGGVQCSECPTWFHIRCAGFSRAVHIPEHWQCPLCNSTGLTQALENLRITTESPESFNPDNDQVVPNDYVTNFFKKRTPTLNRVPGRSTTVFSRIIPKVFYRTTARPDGCKQTAAPSDHAEAVSQAADSWRKEI